MIVHCIELVKPNAQSETLLAIKHKREEIKAIDEIVRSRNKDLFLPKRKRSPKNAAGQNDVSHDENPFSPSSGKLL